MKKIIIALFLFSIVNISFANSEEHKAHIKKLSGTWIITNETADSTYDGTIGQVTFDGDYMIIDFGRFAAAGTAAASEGCCCYSEDPISVKFLSTKVLYVSWIDNNDNPRDSIITIVEKRGNKLTLIGDGGCGLQGVSRTSYLEKID